MTKTIKRVFVDTLVFRDSDRKRVMVPEVNVDLIESKIIKNLFVLPDNTRFVWLLEHECETFMVSPDININCGKNVATGELITTVRRMDMGFIVKPTKPIDPLRWYKLKRRVSDYLSEFQLSGLTVLIERKEV